MCYREHYDATAPQSRPGRNLSAMPRPGYFVWHRLSCGALLTFAALGLAACGGSQKGGGGPTDCLAVPNSIPNLATWGSRLTVRRGAIVYAAIDEAAEYEGGAYLTQSKRPSARPDPRLYNLFPWQAPRSSSITVLKPIRTCPLTRASTLAETVTAFRAVGVGSSTLIASLVPEWRLARYRPPVFRTTVTVRP